MRIIHKSAFTDMDGCILHIAVCGEFHKESYKLCCHSETACTQGHFTKMDNLVYREKYLDIWASYMVCWFIFHLVFHLNGFVLKEAWGWFNPQRLLLTVKHGGWSLMVRAASQGNIYAWWCSVWSDNGLDFTSFILRKNWMLCFLMNGAISHYPQLWSCMNGFR